MDYHILFAQAGAETLNWVQPIINLATAGGFTTMVWYLMVKHIPWIEERHLQERQEWLGYIKSKDDLYQKLVETTNSKLQELREELHNVKRNGN